MKTYQKNIFCAMFFSLISLSLSAQLSGINTLNKFGINLEIPKNWTSQTQGNDILFSSTVHSGILLIQIHKHQKLSSLQLDLEKPYNDEQGMVVMLNGMIEAYDPNSAIGEFGGLLNWKSAKALKVGKINNTNGYGIIVTGINHTEQFDDEFIQLFWSVVNSIQFDSKLVSH